MLFSFSNVVLTSNAHLYVITTLFPAAKEKKSPSKFSIQETACFQLLGKWCFMFAV